MDGNKVFSEIPIMGSSGFDNLLLNSDKILKVGFATFIFPDLKLH